MAVKTTKIYTQSSDNIKTSLSELIEKVPYQLNWEESVQQTLYEFAKTFLT